MCYDEKYLVDERGHRLIDDSTYFIDATPEYITSQLIDESEDFLQDENNDYLCTDELILIPGGRLVDEKGNKLIDDWGGLLCQDPDETDAAYPEYED